MESLAIYNRAGLTFLTIFQIFVLRMARQKHTCVSAGYALWQIFIMGLPFNALRMNLRRRRDANRSITYSISLASRAPLTSRECSTRITELRWTPILGKPAVCVMLRKWLRKNPNGENASTQRVLASESLRTAVS